MAGTGRGLIGEARASTLPTTPSDGDERRLLEALQASQSSLERLVSEAVARPSEESLELAVRRARRDMRRNRAILAAHLRTAKPGAEANVGQRTPSSVRRAGALARRSGLQVLMKEQAKARYKERYRDEWVEASELPGAKRTAMAEPAAVPVVERLRQVDRLWKPEDYADLPTVPFCAPGWTILRDVLVTAPGHVMAADGRFVEDIRTGLMPAPLFAGFERMLEPGAEARSKWPVADDPIERAILSPGPGLQAYGHALLDHLPPLAALDDVEAFADWPLLLPSDSPRWVRPMLEVFSARPREICWLSDRPGLTVRVDELCVPWKLREVFSTAAENGSGRTTGALHPAAAAVYDRVAMKAGRAKREEGDGRRIFIRRPSHWTKRSLANADEIGAVFAAHGFEQIAPEQLPFLDQVRLFASTHLAAGEAGSGLHGTLFSPPGMTTLEIRPPTYRHSAQPAIAVLRGHAFVSLEGVHMTRESRFQDPWRLDPELVEERLSDFAL